MYQRPEADNCRTGGLLEDNYRTGGLLDQDFQMFLRSLVALGGRRIYIYIYIYIYIWVAMACGVLVVK